MVVSSGGRTGLWEQFSEQNLDGNHMQPVSQSTEGLWVANQGMPRITGNFGEAIREKWIFSR